MFFISRQNVCSNFFGDEEKQLYRNAAVVNFKFYDITIWETNLTVDILPNISIIKNNQSIKFDQATEYTERNIFFENSRRK